MKKSLILIVSSLSIALAVGSAFAQFDRVDIGGGSSEKIMINDEKVTDNAFHAVLVSKADPTDMKVIGAGSGGNRFASTGDQTMNCGACHSGDDGPAMVADTRRRIMPGVTVAFTRQSLFTKWEAG